MTDEPQDAPAPLTVAEASVELDKASVEMSESMDVLVKALERRERAKTWFKSADRALTSAYQATRKKTGPRKPKAEGTQP